MIGIASAQDGFVPYQWEQADLALQVPARWEAPIPQTSADGTQETLVVAQSFAATPAQRPPAIPYINIVYTRSDEPILDLFGALINALAQEGIAVTEQRPSELLLQDGLAVSGTDGQGFLFGVGRATYVEDFGLVLIYGRGLVDQRATVEATFNSVADSLQIGAGQAAEAPEYGVLWQTIRTPADALDGFLDVRAMTLTNEGRLLIADGVRGIVNVDSASGRVQDVIGIQDVIDPTGIGVDSAGFIYLADRACACVRVLEGDDEINQIGDFGQDAPRSFALTSDGTIYATDVTEQGAVIKRITNDGETTLNSQNVLTVQPLLHIDQAGRLLALVSNTDVYALQDDVLIPQYELQVAGTVTAMTVNAANNLVVATDDAGIQVFDSQGMPINRIGEIGTDISQANVLSSPQGIATNRDGVIFWAESNGELGKVTAVSLGVEEGRIGATNLAPNAVVQGNVSRENRQQEWLYQGQADERITVAAAAASNAFRLDVALRILAPNGTVVATADNDDIGIYPTAPANAIIQDVALPEDGTYRVIVDYVAGSGDYTLGLTQTQLVDISFDQAELSGEFSEAIPLQRVLFNGQAGQTVTITLRAEDGTFDPLVTLYAPSGDPIAQTVAIDEAGIEAQISQFTLPESGQYTVDAQRLLGEGAYTLTIGQ